MAFGEYFLVKNHIQSHLFQGVYPFKVKKKILYLIFPLHSKSLVETTRFDPDLYLFLPGKIEHEVKQEREKTKGAITDLRKNNNFSTLPTAK